MTFTHAIARLPAMNAGDGLTSAGLGVPDPERMLAQHQDYVRILGSLGLRVTVLDADENFPDGRVCLFSKTTQNARLSRRPWDNSKRCRKRRWKRSKMKSSPAAIPSCASGPCARKR